MQKKSGFNKIGMSLIIFPNLWDLRFIVLFVISMLSNQIIFGQQGQPMIKATSKNVDIKDGETYQKKVWNLSPEIRPDVYYALEPAIEKKIIFYTDIDSISFETVPGKIYPFTVLLNNRDTCFIQITTIKPVSNPEADFAFSKAIEPEMLKQDFSIFRQALKKEHPGLYRYKNKNELDRLFDSCYSMLNHPMQQWEFAKSIMYLISFLEDGHTGTNIPRLLVNYYSENEKMFPAYVFFIKEKAYVLCSRIKELPAGTEILSIDNKPVIEIKKKLLQYLPSDGKIETKKDQTLNNGAFSFLYNWIFGNKNSFEIRCKTRQGKIRTISINAEFVKDFECDPGNESSTKKDLQLDFPQPSTAILTIKTFDDRRLAGKENLKDFLYSSFKEINVKRIDNLIIDLRGNGGGADEYGSLLYSYLTDKPFKYFASIKTTEREINVEENPLLGIQYPQKNNFKGKVLFLINGLCFSTTADFCSIAKSSKRGRFIGEETGGAYYGNTSGHTIKLELPNTKIEIIIPQFKYANDVRKAEYRDRGIIPDHIIIPTIDEVIQHKDVQLNFALKILRGK